MLKSVLRALLFVSDFQGQSFNFIFYCPEKFDKYISFNFQNIIGFTIIAKK